ncbi:MAG: site-specific integrase [Clostridiaceae bacterium]|nr:site-specific integrase [Clostridiaceae bacterium]
MASVKVVLFTSKRLKNGKHPIMLRIIKDRRTMYQSIGHSCYTKQWDPEKECPSREHPNSKILTILIRQKINLAEKLILQYEESGKDYSLKELKKKLSNKYDNISVSKFIDEHIKSLKESNQYGNAKVYNDLKNALLRFNCNKEIVFTDINYSFLVRFEKFFKKRKAKETSISYYMRTLRALYNLAINEGILNKELYPFNEYKISELNTQTAKRALKKEHILKIKQLDIKDEKLINARNYFLFSYYTMGMNFTDMAHMKWNNIIDERLQYTRVKTGRIYSIKLLQPALKIIQYYKENYYQDPEGYIFPILSSTHKTETSKRNRIHKVIGQVNTSLKKIAAAADLEVKLTTYHARHSWATIMKNSGISTAIISAGLGHNSEKTTQIYLDLFENEVLDEANKSIL